MEAKRRADDEIGARSCCLSAELSRLEASSTNRYLDAWLTRAGLLD
jgi:hypothetical protein